MIFVILVYNLIFIEFDFDFLDKYWFCDGNGGIWMLVLWKENNIGCWLV